MTSSCALCYTFFKTYSQDISITRHMLKTYSPWGHIWKTYTPRHISLNCRVSQDIFGRHIICLDHHNICLTDMSLRYMSWRYVLATSICLGHMWVCWCTRIHYLSSQKYNLTLVSDPGFRPIQDPETNFFFSKSRLNLCVKSIVIKLRQNNLNLIS